MSDLIGWLNLKGAQIRAVTARARDVVVTAGAGCGKTHTLVARYLALLNEGLQPGQIVAVTFTEKAAREMRNRIRTEVGRWRTEACPEADRERWEQIEAEIDTARIGTIHSLCRAMLRSHPVEAGIDPRPAVLDEGLAAALRAQAIDDTLSWAVGQDELSQLFGLFEIGDLRKVASDLLVSRLDAEIMLGATTTETLGLQAVMTEIGRFLRDDVVVSAVADLNRLGTSGHLDADAGEKLAPHVLALLEVWSAAERDLAAGDVTGAAEALQMARRHCVLNVGFRDSRAKVAIRAIRERYEIGVGRWLGNDPPDSEVEGRTAEAVTMMGKLFEKACDLYQRAKDLRQALDFDDLESKAAELMSDPIVRGFWQRQTAALLVDEFQDTNERQRKIVEALAGVPDGLRGRLFVVGDAKQSIYRFRGADVAVFRRLDQAIRDRGGEAISLDRTFRAHEPLVGVLNEVLAGVMGLRDDREAPHAVPFAPLRAERSLPRDGVAAPYLEVLVGLGEDADQARGQAAAMLARRLWGLHDREGVDWEDIALLFRASAGFPAYETALEDAGIPFVTVAGQGFYDRPEIRDVLNILRALADPSDDLAMAGLLRSPAFGLSDVALYELRWPESEASPRSFRRALEDPACLGRDADQRQAMSARATFEHLVGLVDRVPVAELIKALLDQTLYPAILASASRGPRLQRNLDKLLADAHASEMVRVGEFLEYVQTLRDVGAREGEATAEAGGAVRLMTVHKAKGLQFPVVVLADAGRGRPPASQIALLSDACGLACRFSRLDHLPLSFRLAKAHEAEREGAEGLRVLYVAATRAREKLLISGHRAKRDTDSWLAKVAASAGLDIEALAQTEGDCEAALPVSGHKIWATAKRTLVEADVRETEQMAGDEEFAGQQPLFHALASTVTIDDVEAADLRIRRVTGRRYADGTIVGTLVHAAIRRWCFPGEAGLARLLHTAALSCGLVVAADIARHVQEASALLAKLRSDARWPELDAAERHHELPFGVLRDHLPTLGQIDLLYRRSGEVGVWRVVEFKSERVDDEAELQSRLERYRQQLQRYEHAVSRLLGGRIESALCFLDYQDGTRWVGLRQGAP